MEILVTTSDGMTVTFTGDDLRTIRGGSEHMPILIVRDGEKTLGEFANWNHWKVTE